MLKKLFFIIDYNVYIDIYSQIW